MKAYFKFTCLYCGQHMECDPGLCGRQMQCPACTHRIVIPSALTHQASSQVVSSRGTWDTCVPKPSVEIPTRYRPCGNKYAVGTVNRVR